MVVQATMGFPGQQLMVVCRWTLHDGITSAWTLSLALDWLQRGRHASYMLVAGEIILIQLLQNLTFNDLVNPFLKSAFRDSWHSISCELAKIDEATRSTPLQIYENGFSKQKRRRKSTFNPNL